MSILSLGSLAYISFFLPKEKDIKSSFDSDRKCFFTLKGVFEKQIKCLIKFRKYFKNFEKSLIVFFEETLVIFLKKHL